MKSPRTQDLLSASCRPAQERRDRYAGGCLSSLPSRAGLHERLSGHRLAAIAATLLLTLPIAAQTAPPPQPAAPTPVATPSTAPLVTIPNTALHVLHSRFVDYDFHISVALPASYPRGTGTYPVLYLCDANVCFGLTTDMCRLLAARDELPELIVVGIGYPGDRIPWWNLRTRDLTPVRDPAGEERVRLEIAKATGRDDIVVPSGGAAAFLQFIREELIPFVESTYRTTPNDRTLAGHSFGGLFATHVLVTQPEAFNRYVIGSPALGWANRTVFASEEAWAASHQDLPARVFMSCGALERPAMIEGMRQMADKLQSRGYPQLVLTTYVFPDETHMSVAAPMTSRGLRVVFDRMPKPAGK